MFTNLQYITPNPTTAITANAINIFVGVSAVVLLVYITTLVFGAYFLGVSRVLVTPSGRVSLLLLI